MPQFREPTPNKSGASLALCNRITEEIRATYEELGVLEPARAPSSPRPRNESDQTHVLATTTNVGQGRIVTHRRRVAIRGPDPKRDAWARPNSNQSSESRLDDTVRESHRREHGDLSILR